MTEETDDFCSTTHGYSYRALAKHYFDHHQKQGWTENDVYEIMKASYQGGYQDRDRWEENNPIPEPTLGQKTLIYFLALVLGFSIKVGNTYLRVERLIRKTGLWS